MVRDPILCYYPLDLVRPGQGEQMCKLSTAAREPGCNFVDEFARVL